MGYLVSGGTKRWMRVVTAGGVALLCAALFGGNAFAVPLEPAPPTTPPASGQPAGTPPATEKAPRTVAELLDLNNRIQQMHQQAEQATERYNAAVDKLAQAQGKVADTNTAVTSAEADVVRLRADMGQLARHQYTTRSIDPLMSLMITNDTGSFLRQAPTYAYIGQSQQTLIDQAKQAQQLLTALQQTADVQLAENKRLEAEAANARIEIQTKIEQAQTLLGDLTPDDIARLTQIEEQAAQAGQVQLGDVLNVPDQLTTPMAAKAITFALSKMGLPYIWGGTGPAGYDCSGLTSQAWASAGRPIPRTSEAQWAGLPRVPVKDVRPGDLIIYYADAHHVGMYIGNGLVVQAPRTGDVIKISLAGSMPILGVVRPDGSAGTTPAPAIPNVPGSKPPGGGNTGGQTKPPTTPPPATTPPPTTQPPTTPPPTTEPPTTPPPSSEPPTTPPPSSEPPSTPPASPPASNSTSAAPPASGSSTPKNP